MPTGASIGDFHLGGYTPSAVLPPSQLTFINKRADLHGRSVLSGAFTLNLSATDANKTNAFDLIYSQGPLDSQRQPAAPPGAASGAVPCPS